MNRALGTIGHLTVQNSFHLPPVGIIVVAATVSTTTADLGSRAFIIVETRHPGNYLVKKLFRNIL